jgi:hypothetical protein
MKVETASIKYIMRNYKINTDTDLGKVPEGMEVDSCCIHTLQAPTTNDGNKMLSVNQAGRMIFKGDIRNIKTVIMLSVYVGFKVKVVP